MTYTAARGRCHPSQDAMQNTQRRISRQAGAHVTSKTQGPRPEGGAFRTWMTRSPRRKTPPLSSSDQARRGSSGLSADAEFSRACRRRFRLRVPAGPFFMGVITCTSQ